MKKHILIILITVSLAIFDTNAQAFKKGDVMLSPGIGLGVYGPGLGAFGFALPIVFNADFGVHDYVSVGAYGGFWTRGNNTWGGGRFNSIHFGARGTFHWWQLLDEKVSADLISDKLDIYFTPWLGYNIRTFPDGWGGVGWWGTGSSFRGNRFQGGALLGARYFFTENIGVFGEFGATPTSVTNWGVTFKF